MIFSRTPALLFCFQRASDMIPFFADRSDQNILFQGTPLLYRRLPLLFRRDPLLVPAVLRAPKCSFLLDRHTKWSLSFSACTSSRTQNFRFLSFPHRISFIFAFSPQCLPVTFPAPDFECSVIACAPPLPTCWSFGTSVPSAPIASVSSMRRPQPTPAEIAHVIPQLR